VELRPSQLSAINHPAANQAALPLENDQRAQLTSYNKQATTLHGERMR
jgi:hypothetical protein